MSLPAPPHPDSYTFDYKHVGGRFLGLVALSLLAYVAVGIGALTDPRQFAFSYLFAFTFFLTLCLGGLFWILVHHAADADWSVVLRRQMENLASLLVFMGLVFLPLVFVAPDLWTWMQPAKAHDPLLLDKWPYLTKEFFWGRAAFYFLFFTLASVWLRTHSILQDTTGSPRHTVINRRIAFASLPLLAITLTFLTIDWLMGVDSRWFSTLWGVSFFVGTALSGLCVVVLTVTALRHVGYFQNIITLEHYHILSKLLLALTLLWAALGFSQYLILWYADLPEETLPLLQRSTSSWQILSIALVSGHLLVPFLLLFPFSKKNPRVLCSIALWILLMHLLDIYVLVLPALHQSGLRPSWLDAACLAAIGCPLAALFLKRLGDSPLWPLRDPSLSNSLALKN